MKFEQFYSELNSNNEGKYLETLKKIREIKDSTSGCSCGSKYGQFINHTADMIVFLCEHEEEIKGNYFENKTFEELLEINRSIYKNFVDEAYNNSYANPEYCVEIFGKEIGQCITTFYMEIVEYIKYAYMHKRFAMAEYNEIFIELFEMVKCGSDFTAEQLTELVTRVKVNETEEDFALSFKERFYPDASGFRSVVMDSDLSDLRYLFKYGKYVTDNEIKTAEFYNKYDEAKIEKIAETYTEGFRNGFIRDNKDMSKKKYVSVIFNVGQEQMIRRAVKRFEAMGLECSLSRIGSTEPNKQMPYDHRFDNGLHLTKEFADKRIEGVKKALESSADIVSLFAGPAVVEIFGEKAFSPESKDSCVKLDDEQSKIFNMIRGTEQQEISKYAPRSEYSFTIIAFPVPEIGDNFEEIFEDTCEVNMLDSNKYEVIQQHIIDALDKGDYIHVKGKGDNQTDVKVKNQKINNPEKETNYVNCVADVNIPVGEVFTSPQLKGTNGVLHVEEVYLNELKYENLKITFKDGYIDEYSCTNFEKEEENKDYIRENLMFPHKTLPLGEFAIGTNTTAYVMANKHKILDIMPILIVEKMGPHFAIGDTCFSWAEDVPTFNPLGGKEITAKDNEKSILRKTNIQEAYTQCHTDITLPYSGIEFIKAVTADGEEIDIIRDGRFVLPGTEALNEAFDK